LFAGIDLLEEMSKQELILMTNGESCWVRSKPTGECWSAHITDTELTHIDDEEAPMVTMSKPGGSEFN